MGPKPATCTQLGVIQSNIETYFKHLGIKVDGEEWCMEHGKTNRGNSSSKYLGLQLISHITRLSTPLKDKLTAQLVTYAMSQVPGLSCIHVKIQ